VEGLASVIVVWRFTGSRNLARDRRTTRATRCRSFVLLIAPYIVAASLRNLFGERRAETTVIGIVLTALAVVLMPVMGYAKRRLGTRLGSAATAGEGPQNYLCAAQAAAVLIGLAVTTAWPGSWWLDPVIGLGIAAVAVWEGVESWRGEGPGMRNRRRPGRRYRPTSRWAKVLGRVGVTPCGKWV
jgi:Cation efflux family